MLFFIACCFMIFTSELPEQKTQAHLVFDNMMLPHPQHLGG